MRIRTLVVIALVTLPLAASAQGIRLPRGGRGAIPEPAPLPPEAAPVARALELKRSRWSAEGYTLISNIQIPAAAGGVTRYTTMGTGTHADYRYTDHFSATIDLTASFLGSPTIIETAELGTRYSPLSWDHEVRPFFDVRAGYMHMYDTFTAPASGSVGIGAAGQQFVEGGRYSRGAGAVSGAGLEYTLTNSLSLTTEVSAMRNRMSTYRFTGAATIPNATTYWMTSYRYVLGLKFNPLRAQQLKQNPGP